MNTLERPTPVGLTDVVSVGRGRHWGGLAFAFGNILFLVNKFDEMSRLFLSRPMRDVISGRNAGLILLGQVALIIGYVAYYRCYAPRTDRTGTYALRLFCGGGIVLAVGHATFISDLARVVPTSMAPYAEGLFLLVFLGLLGVVLGLIWFGILVLRRSVVSHWRWLPLATGLMGMVGFFMFSGETITAIFLFFRTLFALGLVGLGLALWLETPTRNNAIAGGSGA
jgi:hypothetical protein